MFGESERPVVTGACEYCEGVAATRVYVVKQGKEFDSKEGTEEGPEVLEEHIACEDKLHQRAIKLRLRYRGATARGETPT